MHTKTHRRASRGFTLLELLIVIAIIAILSVVLIILINPAETLRKSRDAQRISDLGSIKTALGIYLTSTSTPVLSGAGVTDTLCTATGSFNSTTTNATAQAVNGTGWIPVNLASLTSGAPISNFPLDPTNSGNLAYWYKCDGTKKTFEVSAVLESTEYSAKMTTDGGNDSARYEVGTDLTL